MSICKATRANYAALQHRPGEGRIPLRGVLVDSCGVTRQWQFWVKATTPAQRKGVMTRTRNRLRAMYPTARSVWCELGPF